MSSSSGSVVRVALACSDKFAIIDEQDAHLVAGRTWRIVAGYAVSVVRIGASSRSTRMHRIIMEDALAQSGERNQVDHINRDRLDNRRSNLRLASPTENKRNTGAYRRRNGGTMKGAYWDAARGLWVSKITVARVSRYLGAFATEEQAHDAWRREARELHGDFFAGS